MPLAHKPSDYFRERIWISCDPDERTIPALAERFGADRFLWASDFPHADHTPEYVDDLNALIAAFPESDRRKFAGDNARPVSAVTVADAAPGRRHTGPGRTRTATRVRIQSIGVPADTTPIERDEIFAIVRDRLADILEIEPSGISEGQSFVDDLDADSLALIELVEALEEELSERAGGFRIDDEDLADLKTVRDAVDYVHERTRAGS